MDISLLIMAEDIISHANFVGDIISVSEKHREACSHPRFVIVHITGIIDNVPYKYQFKRLKEMLESPIKSEDFQSEVRSSAWALTTANASPDVMQSLHANREATIPWSRAKLFLGKKYIVDANNPSLDELIFITDGDV